MCIKNKLCLYGENISTYFSFLTVECNDLLLMKQFTLPYTMYNIIVNYLHVLVLWKKVNSKRSFSILQQNVVFFCSNVCACTVCNIYWLSHPALVQCFLDTTSLNTAFFLLLSAFLATPVFFLLYLCKFILNRTHILQHTFYYNVHFLGHQSVFFPLISTSIQRSAEKCT